MALLLPSRSISFLNPSSVSTFCLFHPSHQRSTTTSSGDSRPESVLDSFARPSIEIKLEDAAPFEPPPQTSIDFSSASLHPSTSSSSVGIANSSAFHQQSNRTRPVSLLEEWRRSRHAQAWTLRVSAFSLRPGLRSDTDSH
jgi:hypothetical protein